MANAGRNQQPQVIIVKREHGCLVTALVFVLFGWIGLAAMAAWKLTKMAWHWSWACVAYPTRWTIQGSRWLTRTYGWRGWAVVSVVVVALAILGSIVGNGH